MIKGQPTIDDIKQAKTRLQEIAIRTPVIFSDYFSDRYGCQVYLKLENMQKTGAYKIRGAYNKIAGLTKAELNNGVITASAGNHAQGVAFASRELNIAQNTVVIMAETADELKIEKTKSYGVKVELYGRNFDEANDWAHQEALKRNKTFVEAFNDFDIIAGQGTVGLEIVEDIPDVDLIIVPVGGGGLISGITIAALSRNENLKVIGVQAERAAPYLLSLQRGEPTPLPYAAKTMADGIQVGKVGDLTFSLIKEFVKQGTIKFVSVEDGDILSVMIKLLLNQNLCAEGAGAAALACLEYYRSDLDLKEDNKVALIVSGGNIHQNKLAYYLTQEIISLKHYLNIRTKISNKPGALAELLEIIANNNVNIADIVTHRAGYPFPHISMDETLVEMILETDDSEIQERVLGELRKGGYHIKVLKD